MLESRDLDPTHSCRTGQALLALSADKNHGPRDWNKVQAPPPGPGQLKGQVWDYLLSLAPLVADWPCSVSRQPEAETIWTALVGFPDDWLSLPLTTVSPGKVRRLTVDSQGAETIPLVSCLAQRLSHQEPLMGICWTFNWLSSLVLFRFSCPLTQPSGLSVISPSTRFRSRFVKSPTLWSLIGHLFLLATFCCCCFWRGIQIFKQDYHFLKDKTDNCQGDQTIEFFINASFPAGNVRGVAETSDCIGYATAMPQVSLVNRRLICSRVTLCFKKAGPTLSLD